MIVPNRHSRGWGRVGAAPVDRVHFWPVVVLPIRIDEDIFRGTEQSTGH